MGVRCIAGGAAAVVAAGVLWSFATATGAGAADLPRGASGREQVETYRGYVEGAAPHVRYVDPIQVGRTLPRAIPLKPMPHRYSVIGYGYAAVNGKSLLIDPRTREIVEVLPEQ